MKYQDRRKEKKKKEPCRHRRTKIKTIAGKKHRVCKNRACNEDLGEIWWAG